MTITEKALAAILKDISITLYIIDVRLVSGSFREYNIVKANYYYNKAEKDIEEWLVKIDYMIKANNIIVRRRVMVTTAHFRNETAN